MKWPPGIILLLLLFVSVSHVTAQPLDIVAEDRFYITVDGYSVCVPFVSNRPLDIHQPEVNRIVVLLPGGSRDVVQMWEWYRVGAYQAEVLPSTMLVGIQFLLESDIEQNDLEDEIAFWSHSGWQFGELSESTANHPRPVTVSSFTFMDSLISRVSEVNPQVDAIVISGGSAGAKYTHRYAAGNRVEALLNQTGGPPMVYVSICNGSFVYLSEERRRVDGGFAAPDAVMRGFIPQFNRYPYGLEELNEYCAQTGAANIIAQYSEKYFFYIIGELDTGPNSDNQPMALQGWNNLQRNQFYDEYIGFNYGEIGNQALVVIPDVGHDADLILQHPLAWEALFYFIPD